MKRETVPDVSIVAPVYNVEKYIKASVNSMLAQTHENIEIILVDDGSTDKSGTICDEFEKADPRVHVIHKSNSGAGEARNTGMDAAHGDYIYFCDPDDTIEPNMIEENLRLARENYADIVEFGYWSQRVDSENNPIGDRVERNMAKLEGYYERDDFWKNFEEVDKSLMSLPLHLFRLDFLRENSLRMKAFRRGEDVHFLMDIYTKPFNGIVFNRKRYYTYNSRPGSATKIFDIKGMEDGYIVYQRYQEVLENSPVDRRIKDKLTAWRFCWLILVQSSALVRKGNFTKKEKAKILKEYAGRPEFRKALRYSARKNGFGTRDRIVLFMMRCGLYRTFVEIRSLMGPGKTG